MLSLFKKTKKQFIDKLPFVIYCKPNSDAVIGVFQNSDELFVIDDFTENGFAFVSFDGNKKIYIPHNQSNIFVEKFEHSNFFISESKNEITDDQVKYEYKKLVQKGINAIENNEFQKVVLSRKEVIRIKNFDIEVIFKKLIFNYETAFNYCFFHPRIGLWIGATPEQFLKINDCNIKTVALAGTQAFIEKEVINWQEKEKKEQQLVTDFIESNLNEIASQIKISNPYSFRAGNIVHIKTDIEAMLNSKTDIKKVIQQLHPTPAVCGFPKEEAKDFIMENEGYDREFYTGFLGELNIDFTTYKTENSNLFVNLRCMKVDDDIANLYLGCGITKDSIPENEFWETVNKSLTMKKVL